MACVAVASLLRTIELEFLQPQPRPLVLEYDLISSNKHLIQSFHQKLEFLIEKFDEKRMDGVEAIKHLETKLRDLAFKVEDEIEFLVAHLYHHEEELGGANLGAKIFSLVSNFIKIFKTQPCLKLGQILQCAVEEIDGIEEELVKINNRGELTALDVPPSSQVASHSEDKMIGKNDEFEIIMKVIIEHGSNKKRKIVSLIGTGGIGKTTLAQRVYEDPLTVDHFEVRAWVVASQLHNKRQMLVGLLNSISRQGNVESSTDEADLALKLMQSLMGRRYIVVIDDVWSEEAWDAVSRCFPDDDGNGSRVLLTTRLADVANYTSSDNNDSFSHQMQLLDQSDSWELFCENACRSGGGAEFETIGRPIVEKCKGLPLAIIVVAGLFSKVVDTPNKWESIAKALDSSPTATIAATCSKILLLSYNHLSHHLKACFLYLEVFPEDYEINANELARLWSAEGLVKASKNEKFDAVAKRYVQELMDRNLILVSKWSCCGRKIKVFRVHDVLHAFCVREAQNENLLHVVRENGSYFPQKYFRWVSIQSSDPYVSTHYFSRGCRSIFCFSHQGFFSSLNLWSILCSIFCCSSKLESLNFEKIKLLRVLFFADSHIYMDILGFVHLRYLPELRSFYTSKLSRAWNLQTLNIPLNFGMSCFEFPQLQYFLGEKKYSIDRHPPKFVHQNLQSISELEPRHCTESLFTHVPFVKKIRMAGQRNDLNYCIENLASLQQLERLYIRAYGGKSPHIFQINNDIILLKNLKKLEFQNNCFEWNGINVVCKLPRLEVLKLLDDSCVGKEWELPEDEDEKFWQLIFLQIGPTDDLKDWKARGDHFPKLEHLVLHSCKRLKEIPSGFAEILTLKSTKLEGCLPSVVTSAKEIKEEQLDYLNNIVDVVATNYHFGSEFSELESDENEFDGYESDELFLNFAGFETE